MKLAVTCCIKDEAPYIIDWVAHYMALGFTDIVIFQNDSVDGTDALCAALANAGYIHYIDNSDPNVAPELYRDHPAQRRALNWMKHIDVLQNADYIFPVDIDEYLEFPVDGTFPALLKRLDYPDVVSFAWRMFGSSGQMDFNPQPVTERFTQAAAPDDLGSNRPFKQMKSAYRPKLPKRYDIHGPVLNKDQDISWVTADGRDLEDRTIHTINDFDYTFANLRHYHVKSQAEFMLKIVRGVADRPLHRRHQKGLPAFIEMEVNTMHLPFTGPIYEQGRQIAAKMRSDPSIYHVEQDGIKTFTTLLDLATKAVSTNQAFRRSPYLKAVFTEYFQTEVYDKL
jgi:hypothetical protein